MADEPRRPLPTRDWLAWLTAWNVRLTEARWEIAVAVMAGDDERIAYLLGDLNRLWQELDQFLTAASALAVSLGYTLGPPYEVTHLSPDEWAQIQGAPNN